jgi:hypothetical protein
MVKKTLSKIFFLYTLVFSIVIDAKVPEVVKKYDKKKSSKKSDKKPKIIDKKEKKNQGNIENYAKKIKLALDHVKKKSPGIHLQALKIWKKFKKSGSTGRIKNTPHYTYRYWARDIVVFLREKKDVSFNSPNDVMKVFLYLNSQGIISRDSVILLSADSWSYLVHLFGYPEKSEKSDYCEKKNKEITI